MSIVLATVFKVLCIVGSLPHASNKSALHILECDIQIGEKFIK